MQTQQGRRKGGKTISLTRGRVVGATVALVLAVTVAVGATAILRSGGGGSGGAPPREPAGEASGLREQPGEVAAGLGPVAAPPGTAPTTVAPAPAPEPRGETIEFAGTTFELPEGWTVVDQDVRHWIELDPVTGATTEHPYDNLCVSPADLAPSCGLQLWHGDLPGNEGFGPWEDHGDWPWHQATDPPFCPDERGSSPTDAVVPINGDLGPVHRGFGAVGDHTAVYDRWGVKCEISGFTFSPRTWHLPDSQIVILDMFGQTETEGILRTFRFTG